MFLLWSFIVSLILQILPVSAYGEVCWLDKLDQCGTNETCQETLINTGVCKCIRGYEPDTAKLHCMQASPHTDGSGAGGGYVAAIIITVVLIVVAGIAVVVLQQRYNLLVPLSALCPIWRWCPTIRCPTLNLFGVRSGRSRMMDDLAPTDDDDDPVV